MMMKPPTARQSGLPEWKTFRACRRRQAELHRFPAWRLPLLLVALVLLLSHPSNAQTNWVLVWSDEFNGPAGPFTPTSSNNQFWTFETGQGVFGTGEIENMIADGTTSFLDGSGHLVIKTYLSGSTQQQQAVLTAINRAYQKVGII